MPGRRGTPIERALRNLDLMETGYMTACWLFGGTLKSGYGEIRLADGKRGLVHRVSYEHFVGPIPVGYHVDHLCKVLNCFNPDHLEAVTPAENLRRAETPGARATRTNRCHRGHENWSRRYESTGGRVCMTCVDERHARYKEPT